MLFHLINLTIGFTGATTLSITPFIMTLSITAFIIITHSITIKNITFIKMTLSIMQSIVMPSVKSPL